MSAQDQPWFRDHIHQLTPEVELSEEQVGALFRHFELLTRWNQRMNLTSIQTPAEIVSRHYCESLFFAQHLPEYKPGATILDFGSGAGFPGFPLAVLRPDAKVTLLEANQRRAVFLKESTRGISNIEVVLQRGEKFSHSHDWVIARAVKSSEVLSAIPRLGSRVGLLIGENSANQLERSHCKWSAPLKLPWSAQRVCVYGQCST